MKRNLPLPLPLAVVLLAGPLSACASAPAPAGHPARDEHADHAAHAARADSAFTALQARGEAAMGVDQYTSTHRFEALADGGRIELQRDADDPAGVATIRRHLREIADAFRSGDFGTPAFVHMREMPGTRVMAQRRGSITYTFRELPRGGEVRITTSDPEAVRAVHEFLAAQRGDHRS